MTRDEYVRKAAERLRELAQPPAAAPVDQGEAVSENPTTSTSETCPTCGTTRITFNPPLVFEASEACGAIKPGNWTASYVPVCELPRGHDGDHIHLVEQTVTWPAEDAR